MKRRQFLQTSALLLTAPLCFSSGAKNKKSKEWFISGSDDLEGNHRLSIFDYSGKSILNIGVEQRVHGQAINPARPDEVIFFARRPGTQAYVLDLNTLTLKTGFQAGGNRHFFGHGMFSDDGKYLYSCENNYSTGKGVITVRDSGNWQKLTEFSSYGIGTHQIALMPEGKQIVAANGGIQTHPDMPRKKLNLDTMKPSLTYIDVTTGKHIDSYTPQHHQMSIRHLDIANDGTVGIAIQYQGNRLDNVPLIAFHNGEEKLQYAKASQEIWAGFNQYTASIAIDSQNQIAAVTTPRGNQITFWDMKQRTLIQSDSMDDVAGVAYARNENHFVATTGKGDIFVFAPNSIIKANAQHYQLTKIRWDNHMSYLSM